MKKLFIVLGLIQFCSASSFAADFTNSLFTASVQASTPVTALSKDAALFGTWESMPMVFDGGLQMVLSISFAADGVTMANTCSAGGDSVTVSVKGDFDTDGNTISVTGNDTKSDSKGGVTCNVQIKPAQVTYQLNGGMFLDLTMQGQTLNLHKKN